jgi:hypothetical protein
MRAGPGLGLFEHLAVGPSGGHASVVWRPREPALDRETVDGIIRMLMTIDAKLDRLLGEEEEDDAAEAGP